MGRSQLCTFTVALCAVALAATRRPASAGDRSVCDPSTTNCRTMVVNNTCTQTVSVATLGNAVNCKSDADCPTAASTCNTTASVCTCAMNTDCATGTQVCDTTASPARCAYAQPLAGGEKFASGTTATTDVPDHAARTNTTAWGARFSAPTGRADFATCGVTGTFRSNAAACCGNVDCNAAARCDVMLGCPVGVSGQAPTTLAEFTLPSGAAD